ncbi:hypothetical protein predicted by Glimmer/Critica [Lactiplantibacillus plantarum]|nr:hypothetical protein predicted by Glimmer/Critica [Lactiplantibacillus plantarum]
MRLGGNRRRLATIVTLAAGAVKWGGHQYKVLW